MGHAWDRWEKELLPDAEPWELARAADADEREDALSRDISFGTGGIRALMGIGPNRLNRLTVARASAGLASYLRQTCKQRPRVVVAYDTRCHSWDFARVAAGTFAAAGVHTLLFAVPCATPLLSFAVPYLGADAGVVITASHNPMEYNGYKVYGSLGDQATDELAHAVQAAIREHDPFRVQVDSLEQALEAGRVEWVDKSLEERYVQAVLEQSCEVSCSDLLVTYSPLNGCGLSPVRATLDARGVRYLLVDEQCEPDGTFATCPRPNPELPDAMSRTMELALLNGADLALANDPDVDRLGVAVRHEGQMRLLTGDEVGLLLLDFVCRAARLPKRPIAITTIVSSPLLDAIAKAGGTELRRTLTGFKYIGEQINLLEEQGCADDFVIGVEESCGYLRGSYLRDKDGVVALMLVCEMAAWHKAHGADLVEALEEIYERHGYIMSRQVSVEFLGVEGRCQMDALMARLRKEPPKTVGGLAVVRTQDYLGGAPMPGDESQTLPSANVVQLDLVDGCRLIVRPSGTEPKVKAYCFACGSTRAQAKERLALMEVDARELARG